MTSTSGNRKCRSAMMPAIQAQSSMLPQSEMQCRVILKAQTSTKISAKCQRQDLQHLPVVQPECIETLYRWRHFFAKFYQAFVIQKPPLPMVFSVSRQVEEHSFHLTYLPGSYSGPAIADISEYIEIVPSKGLSGVGLTIFASTNAITL